MDYLKFSLLFIVVHGVSYVIAGALALKVSGDIYESKNRHCDFLKDMADPEESGQVQKLFFPAQLLRGLLMSVLLYPVLGAIRYLPFAAKLFFFAGLMFVYTHFAAASPFMDNIEGCVYFKEKYLQKKYFWKFQGEMVIYSVLFGLLMSLFI